MERRREPGPWRSADSLHLQETGRRRKSFSNDGDEGRRRSREKHEDVLVGTYEEQGGHGGDDLAGSLSSALLRIQSRLLASLSVFRCMSRPHTAAVCRCRAILNLRGIFDEIRHRTSIRHDFLLCSILIFLNSQ